MCYERVNFVVMYDIGKDINGMEFKYGFGGKFFSVCLYFDLLIVLENVKVVWKVVDEVNWVKFYVEVYL